MNLIDATRSGDIESVKRLIAEGADVNAANKDGDTALSWAAYEGHLELAGHLIEAGANVDATDEDGVTALLLAAYKGHLEVVTKLLELGADVNTTSKYDNPALSRAVSEGHLDLVEKLLELSADVNAADEYGGTALMKAAQMGHLELVAKLVELGADVNVVNEFGNTALLWAAYKGHLEVVTKLLEAGAEYDLVEGSLYSLVKSGDIEAISKLLDEGGYIDELSSFNRYGMNFPARTALQIAMRSGNTEIASLLLSKDAKIEPQDAQLDKTTALEIALSSDNLKLSVEMCARGFSAELLEDLKAKGYEFLPGTDIPLKPCLTVKDFKELSSAKESSGAAAAAAASSAASCEPVISLDDLLRFVFDFNNDKALSAFLDLSGIEGLERVLHAEDILHNTTSINITQAIAAYLIEPESKKLILASLLQEDSSGKSAISYLQEKGILEPISLIFGIETEGESLESIIEMFRSEDNALDSAQKADFEEAEKAAVLEMMGAATSSDSAE